MSTNTEYAITDLMNNALACDRFRQQSDEEAQHGCTAVQQFSSGHALGFDLRSSSILEPLVLIGGGGRRHGQRADEGILNAILRNVKSFGSARPLTCVL